MDWQKSEREKVENARRSVQSSRRAINSAAFFVKAMTTNRTLYGKWLTLAHIAWYVCAALVVIVLLAALPVYYSRVTQPIIGDPFGLGQFNAPFQVLVDLGDLLGSYISFALALLLFWRKPNERMALFVSFFCLVTATTGIFVLENVLTSYFGAPPTQKLWSGLQTPLWILLICTFPNGQFVPRWTRWIFLVSIPLAFVSAASADLNQLVSAISAPVFFLLAYLQVYRYRRVSSFAERQQTKWWLYGVFVALLLYLAAMLVYKTPGTDPLLNVTPIFLTLAILRSRLWDIDVIIRKTVTYTIVVAIWLIVYFGGVILFQQIFANVTGQRSEVITVISTLVIAALFIPLRNRIQNVIDKRFYRKKYDAQQVLQDFANTVRDETDLEKLTGRLIEVVNETMQPTNVSVWLKDAERKTK